MKCDEIRRHWHLFHDSEGDAQLHLQINQHLQSCSNCARWFFEQSRLEDGITQKLTEEMLPTAELWAGIEKRLTPTRRVKSRNLLILASAVVVSTAAIFISVAMGIWSQHDRSESPDLARLAVAVHDQLVSGKKDVAFSSASHVEVENYLRGQVTFPVRCPPRENAGFEVRGGGTCQLASDSVAYVVGHVDGKDVSIFILSRDSLPHFPDEDAVLRGRLIYQCRRGNVDVVMKEIDRNVVLVVGQAERSRLERVLRAYGSYAEGHGKQDG